MKIVIRMFGGLANRMFQLAFYKALTQKGYLVYIDNNVQTIKLDHELLNLQKIFPNLQYNLAEESLVNSLGGGYDLFSKIRRHVLKFSTKVIEFPILTDDNPLDFNNDKYIIGGFQSEKYFFEIKNLVRKDFTFSSLGGDKNIRTAKKMDKENSVAIHIRKGNDYFSSPYYHNTCPVDYFKEAITYIKNKINNPVFYLFTDNIDWVKNHFSMDEFYYINWNPSTGWGNHFDMQLMTHCHYNIISNSTYSWWGAWLNSNKDKIVICPKTWYSPQKTNKNAFELGIASKNWVLI